MKNKIILSLIVLAFFCLSLFRTNFALAGSLTNIEDILSRIQKSQNSDHEIKFRVTSAVNTADDEIVVNFANGFDISSVVAGDITLRYGSDSDEVYGSCTSDCYEATVASSAGEDIWGIGVSGQNLTFSGPTIKTSDPMIASNNFVLVKIENEHIENPSTADSYTLGITTQSDGGASTYDTGSFQVVIIDNDQVLISGNVDPTIAFSISQNNVTFGDLLTSTRWATTGGGSNSETTASIATVSTNASRGFQIKISDANSGGRGGLYSFGVTHMITAYSQTNYAAQSEAYSVYAISSSGMTVDDGFIKTTGTQAINSTSQRFAYYDDPVENVTVDIGMQAKISSVTPAGAYNDTITLLCYGQY